MMKNKFLFAICASIVLIGCRKAEVVDSEVRSQGVEATRSTLVEEDSLNKYHLVEYQSWLDLNLTTKGQTESRVSVPLQAKLFFVNKVELVDTLHLKPLKGSEVRYETGFVEEQVSEHITVVDSVFVYCVNMGQYNIEYRLRYQVPIYDDGFTHCVMPHHRIEFVSESDFERDDRNGWMLNPGNKNEVFATNRVGHSIVVRFGDQTYEVKANVGLRKIISNRGLPAVVRSEVSNSRSKPEYAIQVRHFWNNGSYYDKGYVEQGDFGSHISALVEGGFVVSIPDLDLGLGSPEFVSSSRSVKPGTSESIYIVSLTENYVARGKYFDVLFEQECLYPMFDNGVDRGELIYYRTDFATYKSYSIEKTDQFIYYGELVQEYRICFVFEELFGDTSNAYGVFFVPVK